MVFVCKENITVFLEEGLPPKVSNSKDNVIGIGIYTL